MNTGHPTLTPGSDPTLAAIALVTGASRGIGAATAIRLAAAGYDVCIGYRSDNAAAQAVAEAVQDHGRRAVTVQADIGNESDVLRLFAACDELGSLSALVNSAGIVADKARVDEITLERFNRLLTINVTGTFLCCREAVRRMSTLHGGDGGSIVNVSSVASRIGSPGEYVDYAASKGAVDTFSVGLAKEVALEGIRVNVVRPGIIDTDIHASGGQPDRAQRLAHLIPQQRPGAADEVAAAICWLLSDEASYATGSILDVSGGR